MPIHVSPCRRHISLDSWTFLHPRSDLLRDLNRLNISILMITTSYRPPVSCCTRATTTDHFHAETHELAQRPCDNHMILILSLNCGSFPTYLLDFILRTAQTGEPFIGLGATDTLVAWGPLIRPCHMFFRTHGGLDVP